MAQRRGVDVRAVVDKDRNGVSYYSSTEEWTERLGLSRVRDDEGKEACEAPAGFKPPCRRPRGFDGPLQCLAYLINDQWLVAGHAARNDFTFDAIMHHKFAVIDDEWVWSGSANISDSGTGGYNANAVWLVRSRELAALFLQEWRQMWEGRYHCAKSGDGVDRRNASNRSRNAAGAFRRLPASLTSRRESA